MATLFLAAMREWKRSQESAIRAGFQGVQKRIEKVMDVQLQKEVARLESRQARHRFLCPAARIACRLSPTVITRKASTRQKAPARQRSGMGRPWVTKTKSAAMGKASTSAWFAA